MGLEVSLLLYSPDWQFLISTIQLQWCKVGYILLVKKKKKNDLQLYSVSLVSILIFVLGYVFEYLDHTRLRRNNAWNKIPAYLICVISNSNTLEFLDHHLSDYSRFKHIFLAKLVFKMFKISFSYYYISNICSL